MFRYGLTTGDDSEDTAEYDQRDKKLMEITLEQRLSVHSTDRASFCHIRGALRGPKALYLAKNWVPFTLARKEKMLA
jgi:hypothetical protein